MKTDELLIAQIEDKIQQADDWGVMTSGDFLDTHQRKVVSDYLRGRKLPVKVLFYGGWEDAERCMAVFVPEFAAGGEGTDADGVPAEIQDLLRVVRVSVPKGGRELTHRDYLGSLLALGLDREVTGDILVRKGGDKSAADDIGSGADIIVKTEIAEFIEMNYTKAGRTNLEVEILPISSLCTGEINIAQKQDTVASLRLDGIVASAFGLSRAKAAEAIRHGIVSVNSMEALKVDQEISEGDKIVMRGRGKVVLAQVGGVSRKDRVRITFNVYR
ncbi:MAG: RNA-binding protein [Firmicutes bacterium]|nr:RNA-binding protein [Bacillota bacterium]